MSAWRVSLFAVIFLPIALACNAIMLGLLGWAIYSLILFLQRSGTAVECLSGLFLFEFAAAVWFLREAYVTRPGSPKYSSFCFKWGLTLGCFCLLGSLVGFAAVLTMSQVKGMPSLVTAIVLNLVPQPCVLSFVLSPPVTSGGASEAS